MRRLITAVPVDMTWSCTRVGREYHGPEESSVARGGASRTRRRRGGEAARAGAGRAGVLEAAVPHPGDSKVADAVSDRRNGRTRTPLTSSGSRRGAQHAITLQLLP